MGSLVIKVLVLLFAFISLHMVEGCNPNYTLCPNGGKCIAVSWICDNDNDCGDRSDESYCSQTSPISCPVQKFQCSSGNCLQKSAFCDGVNDCGDNSDEFYCNFDFPVKCPHNWVKCNGSNRCIQKNWICDGSAACPGGTDERNCPSTIKIDTKATVVGTQNGKGQSLALPRTGDNNLRVSAATIRNIRWLLSRRKSDFSTNRWGHELPRIATALYLADPRFFLPGNRTGEEMAYELTIQLLHKLSGNNTMRSQELALYIHGLMVTCTNPSDFFGHNLVSELRRKVEASNYTNPFEILALCNAGDNMTNNDIERVTSAFDSPQRPFWTDTQAIASMAMQCLATSPHVRVDERMVKDMQDELKKRQFRNGTVENPITTALVVQALLSKESYKEYFDLSAAIAVMLASQKMDGSWGSIRNSYYVLPALFYKSHLNISSRHCPRRPETEAEALQKLQEANGEKFIVQYSVWIGNDVDLGRTWRIRMKTSSNNSFYDVIETVRKLDSKHNVTYNVIDNKPYVSALYGKEDDPELGVYWFTYVRSLLSPEEPKLVEASPVDMKVAPLQELILWYKPGSWNH